MRPQFSMRAALVSLTLCTFALAGLVYANALWASAWFSLVLAWLACVGLTAAFSRGSLRAFSLGVLLTGSTYLVLLYGPGCERRVGFWLLTTKSLAAVGLQRDAATFGEEDLYKAALDRETPQDEIVALLNASPVGTLPQWTYFQMVGHSVFALLFSWGGGLFAAHLYDQRLGSAE